MPNLTEDRVKETQIPLEKPEPLEGPETLGYTGDDVYYSNTPYKEGQILPHYLRPIELRQSRHMDEKNPYERARIFEEAIRPRPMILQQYMHMFPYHDVDDIPLESYEKYKLSPKRPVWDDKRVNLYSYQDAWAFATAMTDNETVWLGPRLEFYSPIPDFRINHEDPGHPMTSRPGWTEDDVDIKGQIYASVRSSNRIYTT